MRTRDKMCVITTKSNYIEKPKFSKKMCMLRVHLCTFMHIMYSTELNNNNCQVIN